jgi:hypothetical protein
MSEPARLFEPLPTPVAPTPPELLVLAAIPPAPAFVEYWRLVRNVAPLGQAEAQQALVGLVTAARAHVFPHPERPGDSAVARGPLPIERTRRRKP